MTTTDTTTTGTTTTGTTTPERRSAFRNTDPALQSRVEQFLTAEAELLDDQRYFDWIELFTDDVRYWVPTRVTRTNRERDREIAGDGELMYIDDNKFYLKGRVRRLSSGIAWSEEPPSRTRRLISNVRIDPRENEELQVTCNFAIYRNRLERNEDWFVGERIDILRPADLETTGYPYRIASRKVVLTQATLLAPSISFLL